jgi:drug/metabolite transporter (DMT)-like permease
MDWKTLLIITRSGFIIAVVGLFITIISYFFQRDFVLGIALLVLGIVVFVMGALMESRSKHALRDKMS